MQKSITIATRKSLLALWQAEHIKSRLEQLYPGIEISLLKLSTTGDKFLNESLSKIGGKGLFVKELERALLNKEADIAVHSMKDVPATLPNGLSLNVITQREDPRDAFISSAGIDFDALPKKAVIGTSSLRRAVQLQALRPDIQIKPLRGNIHTRLDKAKQFDGIILAAAGLIRMDFIDKAQTIFTPAEMIPAVGQGALGIECRTDDTELHSLLSPLACATTERLVLAERFINAELNGSCDVPIAVHASKEGDICYINAMVGNRSGTKRCYATGQETMSNSHQLAVQIVEQLIEDGAQALLRER